MNTKTYWHFIKDDRRLCYGDGRLVEVGKTLSVTCEPMLCERGLHASERLIDALNYAPGLTLCKVTLGGNIVKGDDKVVGTERTAIAIADVTDIVKQWARRVAIDVAHLWDAPPVVLEFLNGDDSKAEEAERAAARAARAANAAWAAANAAWAAWAAEDFEAAKNKYNAWLEDMVESTTWEISE